MNAATVQVVLDGIALIAKLVGGEIGEKAGDVLTVVKVIVDAIVKVVDGHLDADKVREEFATMAVKLAANDAAVDKALNEKFPGQG